MTIREVRRGVLLAIVVGMCLAGPRGGAQVHVEKSQDGKLVVTDQGMGGQVVYAPQGSALNWRHKDGWLEVYEPAQKGWVRAPGDYPQVQASGSLILGFGPGTPGSVVYDAARRAWVPQADRHHQGAVSEKLAVGYGGPGRIAIYDARTGSWQSPNVTGESIALSDSLVALFGVKSTTSIYDATRGAWKSDISPFSLCSLGESLVVFYGPPGTNTEVYDVGVGRFVLLKEAVNTVQLFGGTVVALGDRLRAYVYCSRTAPGPHSPDNPTRRASWTARR